MMQYVVPKKIFAGAFIPNWLLEQQSISANAKLVYAHLTQISTDEGLAFPKQETMAVHCGMAIRTFARALSELEAGGLIEKEQLGLNKPNQYRFPRHEWMNHEAPAPREQETLFSSPPTKDVAHHVRSEKGQRLPEDWQPSADTEQWAIDLIGEDQHKWRLESFRDYWLSKTGRNAVKSDWNRAYKNWIRNEIDYGKVKPIGASVVPANRTGFQRGVDARGERQSAITAALARRMGGVG